MKTIERNIRSFTSSLNRPTRAKKSISELYREGWAAAGKGDTKVTEKILNSLKSSKVDDKYLELISAHLDANPAPEPVEEVVAPSAAELEAAAKAEAEAEAKKKREEEKKAAREAARNQERPAEPVEEESSNSLVYGILGLALICLLYTSPSPRDLSTSRMPSSA